MFLYLIEKQRCLDLPITTVTRFLDLRRDIQILFIVLLIGLFLVLQQFLMNQNSVGAVPQFIIRRILILISGFFIYFCTVGINLIMVMSGKIKLGYLEVNAPRVNYSKRNNNNSDETRNKLQNNNSTIPSTIGGMDFSETTDASIPGASQIPSAIDRDLNKDNYLKS
ncbi:hypothetical protein HK096_005981, partial [Nowakowskiella sp. JEL0078]